MPTDTFPITASGNDKSVLRPSATNEYPPAGTIVHSTTGTTMEVARIGGGNYQVANVCMKWDTSSLPDDAIISSAILRVQVTNKTSVDGRSLTLDWYVLDGTSADYSITALTTAYAGIAIASLASGVANDFTLINLSNISRTGITGLRMHISGGQPSDFNYVDIASYDHATLTEPQLIVTYTVPVAAGDSVGAVGV